MMDFVILALATWRISSIVTNEAGPWNLLVRFRHRIGVRYDDHSEAYGENVLAELFTCVWCISLWVGIAWALAFYFEPRSVLLALPFALSSGAIVIEEVVNGTS